MGLGDEMVARRECLCTSYIPSANVRVKYGIGFKQWKRRLETREQSGFLLSLVSEYVMFSDRG